MDPPSIPEQLKAPPHGSSSSQCLPSDVPEDWTRLSTHPSGWKHSWSSVTASKQLRLNQCLRWLRGAWGQSWTISPLRSEALWTLKVISEMITPRAEIGQDQQHGLFLWLVGKGGASLPSCKVGWSGVLALSFRGRLTQNERTLNWISLGCPRLLENPSLQRFWIFWPIDSAPIDIITFVCSL